MDSQLLISGSAPCIFCGCSSGLTAEMKSHSCRMKSNSLCDPCVELVKLERQIAELQSLLSQSLEKHRQLRSLVNHCHNKLMHQMPPEVVSEIFQFCMPQGSPNHYIRRFESKFDISAPLVLGAVCRGWRRIAWSTPRLWNSIPMDLVPALCRNRLPLAREWLSRSGELPLSIFINANRAFSGIPSTSGLTPLIFLLNEYAHRWQHLQLELPTAVFSLLGGDPQDRSILETLKLIPLEHHEEVATGAFCPDKSYHRPTLVDVAHIPFSSIGIDWSNVVHVRVENFSVDQLFELIRSAPSMNHCNTASVTVDENRYPDPRTFISHPNLQVLHFGTEDEEADLFFCHVSFPSLKSLTLERSPINNVTPLLKRSSPPLKDLTLVDPVIEDDELLQLLEAAPTLTTLSITTLIWDYNPETLFRTLSDSSLIGSDESCRKFLPNLETFDYLGVPNYPWVLLPKLFGPISELDHPRRRPLSTLWIRWLSDEDSDEDDVILITDREAVSQIQDYIDKGMKVEIENVSSLGYTRDILGLSIELHK